MIPSIIAIPILILTYFPASTSKIPTTPKTVPKIHSISRFFTFCAYSSSLIIISLTSPLSKYNILKNTYTKLAEIPYEFYQGSAVGIETDIYLFGTNSSGQRNKAYKYDTKTNEYTKITDIPVAEFYNKCVVSIGTDIYLIDIYNKYKYNTITNEYIALEEKLPYDFLSGSTVIINKNIYLLGGSYKIEYAKQAYKLTVTITQPEITKYKYDKVRSEEHTSELQSH